MNAKIDKVELSEAVGATSPHSRQVLSKAEQLNLIKNKEVHLDVRLGTVQITIGELLDLRVGAAVSLEQMIEEPVDILLNGSIVARGHLVVVEDNFGIEISEVAGH